jgi:bifunctional UDP-N-acetylglucosamine pyrophosphorylase/glucosamine-1-phosphate N-acetyltransferase
MDASFIISIVGHHREKVIDFLDNFASRNNSSSIKYSIQAEQLGTGHAVQQAEDILNDFSGNVLILSGDVPLLKPETIAKFIQVHQSYNADLSVLTSLAPEPFGYGRIIRNPEGTFQKIVEEKDANDIQKKINEINSGIYLVDKELLFSSLQGVKNSNAQAEYYLTDIIEICKNQGKKVFAHNLASFEEIQGINSQSDLENVSLLLG